MTSLFITQEYAPFFAEGGLGLASAALPEALGAHQGLDHHIVLPYYPWLVHRFGLRTEKVLELPEREVAGVRSAAVVHRLVRPESRCEVFLVRADEWYDRSSIYRDERYRAFEDETERAAFFGWCVAEWVSARLRRYGLVHGNDWQSGAAMAHVRDRLPALPQLLTVHNATYRGDLRGLDPLAIGLPHRDARRRPSLLLAAIDAADAVVTCSEGYARELTTAAGSDPVAAALRRTGLVGIPLGVDGQWWHPGAAGRASLPFDAETVAEGKLSNKAALQARLGLRRDPLPVVGVCARLVPEKGIDLLLRGLHPLLYAGRIQLVLVGPATEEIRGLLDDLRVRAADLVAHVPRFDQDVAWLTYAGADLTVMPSRVEPGGLNQLIAYRYGTIPVVSPVGGLRDTVIDLRRNPPEGTGFLIPAHTHQAVRDTVRAALDWMAADPVRLVATRRRLMALDWSWARTAQRYAMVYGRLTAPGARRPAASPANRAG
jgi:starch synthase